MNVVRKYISSVNNVDLDGLEELMKDFPEIEEIINNNNKDFAKISKTIDESKYDEETKRNIKSIFLNLTNLLSESSAFKHLSSKQIEMIEDLCSKLSLKDEKIKHLESFANRTEEGKKMTEKLEEDLFNKMDIIVKTKNNTSVSKHRSINLKQALIKQKGFMDKIYLKEDLNKIDELKNKKKVDIEAVVIKKRTK